MPITFILLTVVCIAMLLLNTAVCWYVARLDSLTTAQKLMQMVIVWAIPVVGALVIYKFHQADAEPIKPGRRTEGPFESMEG